MYKRPSHTSFNHNPYMQKKRAQKKVGFTVVDGTSSSRNSVHFFLCFLLVLFVLSVLGMQYISMQSSQARASLNSADNNAEKLYSIGESYQDSFCNITLLSCFEYTQYDTAFAPADGNKIVVALFQFKNLSDTELPVQFQDFSCYADKTPCEPYYTISTQGIYFYSVLTTNEECTGAVAFEVPISTSCIQFQYQPSFASDQSIYFIVD